MNKTNEIVYTDEQLVWASQVAYCNIYQRDIDVGKEMHLTYLLSFGWKGGMENRADNISK